ncbi:diguanylate cyclase [Melissospora conviva]|uniref:sensor domain-containing diguanylate cyclase n=1 Tax=Melissospora conviva TaxID=3388432 RepID=UPI003B7611DC
MTLRGRLTAAFLAVVLGPVLLGAFFVAGTMSQVGHQRAVERLELAANAARTSVGALCRQLHGAADTIAVTADPAHRAAAVRQLVGRGVAAAIAITDPAGRPVLTSPEQPVPQWLDCAATGPVTGGAQALGVRVELRDGTGTVTGSVIALQPVDPGFVARLSGVTGAAVTLLTDTAGPPTAAQTTEADDGRDEVLATAAGLRGDGIAEAGNGRYVRRVGPDAEQPLPLVLSVPGDAAQGRSAVLIGAVLLAALLAVLAARALARSTTRPLDDLAYAVELVAQGDLTARVPVSSGDEIGRLAATFNRMTRETQSYVQALTGSRDQLRGHLAVLGDMLASTHDLPGILRVILRSALAATGAQAGLVLLVDPGSGTLVGQCGEGLQGRWPHPADPTEAQASLRDPRAIRVPIGVGVIGRVAATGEPRRGRVGPDRPLSRQEPACETYVAVPFTAPGVATGFVAPAPRSASGALAPKPTVLGVLVLYDRLGSDEFADEDLHTLGTFAGHAAVAVENVRVHEEVQRLSLTDPLTGLWNYRYLKESLHREVERASRFGRMLSVLVLDLDRFKEVNDTYGHAAGDVVLAAFAGRVRGEIREVDLAFRQGGEEFVVLLPETDAPGAAVVAERLGAAIRDTPIPVQPHSVGGVTPAGPALIAVTVSIGIAVFPDHAGTGQEVLDAADDALYAAKSAGRDTYRMAVRAPRADGPVPPTAPAGPGTGRVEPVAPRAVEETAATSSGASSVPRPPRSGRGG